MNKTEWRRAHEGGKGEKMQRLIDAHELWAQIYILSYKHRWKDRTNIAFSKCLDAIQFFPTVDAEPVRHGHWIPFGSMHRCSICEETVLVPTTLVGIPIYDYCPHCGADMRAEHSDVPVRTCHLVQQRR